MNLLEKLQEKYIEEFTANIPLDEFLLNILVVAMLVSVLRWYYVRFGWSVANRAKFASNFMPIALGTLLIITIVKSSLALSLGLVGALSIVRFRAAIKDPEELSFLFIAIGIGLAGGANQPILAVVAFVVILLLLYVNRSLGGKVKFRQEDKMFINITTEEEDLEQITKILTGVFSYVELKRMDSLKPGMDLSYICKADSIAQVSQVKKTLLALSGETQISIVDQPDLMI